MSVFVVVVVVVPSAGLGSNQRDGTPRCPSQRGDKSLQIERLNEKKTHRVRTANQNFVFTSFFPASLLSTQWRKPSSGSLSADGDTVGGWLELPSTVGEGRGGGGEGAGGLAINQGERGGAD